MARVLLSALLVFGIGCPVFAEFKVEVTPDHENGVYAPGELVDWTIHVADEQGKPADGQVRTSVLQGGLTSVAEKTETLQKGLAHVSATRDRSGVLLLRVQFQPDGAKSITGLGGAVFAPEQIAVSTPPPDDFDQFWKAKIGELHDVPANVQLERIDVGDPRVEYYKVTMDNIRGRKIHGQLAKPAGKDNLPAMLQVQWAGVYPLQREWVLGPARSGWLMLNIIAHDLPIDAPAEFYQHQTSHELNDYRSRGNDDREMSYFLPMFLSCYRAVDYLTERPDWNKKVLVVQGGSQGGYQALVTAGLHPAVTAMAANVPAGCDHTGKQAGRSPGWPNWAGPGNPAKEEAKMLHTARYFDAMNFARRIKCPAIVGVGLIDTTCPPEGVIATFNQIQGPKELVVMPLAGHQGKHDAYYPAYNKFLEAAKQGK